jgi:hypothetical protein
MKPIVGDGKQAIEQELGANLQALAFPSSLQATVRRIG